MFVFWRKKNLKTFFDIFFQLAKIEEWEEGVASQTCEYGRKDWKVHHGEKSKKKSFKSFKALIAEKITLSQNSWGEGLFLKKEN